MRKLILTLVPVLTMAACSHSAKHEDHDHSHAAPAAVTGPSEAQAVLVAASGKKIKGTIHFKEEDGKILVTSNVEGLKPGPHGFHIHEFGDCNASDFATAGGHFNPSQTQHGSVASEHRHGGDMGNLMANKKGRAQSALTIEDVTLKDGKHSIIGKSVIIHAGKDDLKSQPAGNSGAREACGIIQAL